MLYFLTFMGVAFFPLALAGYGGHLAGIALPDRKKRNRALLLVWGLAAAGVLLFGAAEYLTYKADTARDAKETTAESESKTFQQNVLTTLGKIATEPDPTKKKQEASRLIATGLHSYIETAGLELHPAAAPPYLRLNYRNNGVIPTVSESFVGRTSIVDIDSQSDQKKLALLFADTVADFDRKAQASPCKQGPIDPGGTGACEFGVGKGSPFTAAELNEIYSGAKWIYFVGGKTFSDTTGKYRRGFCYVLVPPQIAQSGLAGTWAQCQPSNLAEWEREK